MVDEYDLLSILSRRGGASLDTILQSSEIEDKRGVKEVLSYLVQNKCVAEIAATPTMYSITSLGRYVLLRHSRDEEAKRKGVSMEKNRFIITTIIAVLSLVASVVAAVFGVITYFS